MMYTAYYESPIGMLEVQSTDCAVTSIKFVDQKPMNSNSETHAVTDQAIAELEEYFKGVRKEFTIPLDIPGTAFQKNALFHVKNVPYGETRSYREIAALAGNEKAVRAIGNANRKNDILIVIPCHRIIGTNMKLTGYAAGLWRKEWLLNHEKSPTE